MAPSEVKTRTTAIDLESALIRSILEGVELYPNLDGEDFREMAKFEEQTNVFGLPVHPIRRPVGDLSVREFVGKFEDLPDANPLGPVASLRELLSSGPNLLIRGVIAAGCARPFRVMVVVPQSEAHLAHGFANLLWPCEPLSEEASDLVLVQVPFVADRFLLHVPVSKLALVAGTDDLRPSLLMIMEAAHRLWLERTVNHESLKAAQHAARPKDFDRWEEIRLLPGGCFPFQTQTAPGLSLVFTGESIPDEWERIVSDRVEDLRDAGAKEVFLASSEPWVAEGGSWICPLWRNPPLSARELAAAPRWAEAALHPDAVPFGTNVNHKGGIDLELGTEDAFVIVPRSQLPRPFLNSAKRAKVAKLLTHRFAKDDAMELWARGFPAPEVIYGSVSCF